MARIYLVEDHVIVRDGLRLLLEGAGHEVVGESAEAQQALREIVALQPQMVLLDIHLQAGSGLELLGLMQQRKLPVRVLVLTMSAQPRTTTEAMRLGAAGYVLKGSSSRELLQAVQAVAQGQRHLGQGVAELLIQGTVAAPPDNPLAQLSPRERQIVRLVVTGHSSTAIGTRLNLSPKTVDSYRSRLMAKLGVGDVTALVRLAVREGLVDDGDDAAVA